MIVPTLDALMRVLIVTPLVYLAAVALLRVSGKRSLAKLNAFDLIVTVALGSVLAGTVTSSSTALLTGVTGFGLLLLLQIVVSWLTSRRRAVCLESDGSVSVITDSSVGDGSALADVRGWRAD